MNDRLTAKTKSDAKQMPAKDQESPKENNPQLQDQHLKQEAPLVEMHVPSNNHLEPIQHPVSDLRETHEQKRDQQQVVQADPRQVQQTKIEENDEHKIEVANQMNSIDKIINELRKHLLSMNRNPKAYQREEPAELEVRELLKKIIEFQRKITPVYKVLLTGKFFSRLASLIPDLPISMRDNLNAALADIKNEFGLTADEIIDRFVTINDTIEKLFRDSGLVQIILKAGSSEIARDSLTGLEEVLTPLMKAVDNGDLALTRQLVLEQHHDVNEVTLYGTALIRAVKGNHIDIAQFLLEQKASINGARDWCDVLAPTALTLAAREKNKEMVMLLLKNNADIAEADLMGRTALYYAVKHGWTDVVEWLLDHGADINTSEKSGDYDATSIFGLTGWNLGMLAAHHGHSETLRLLLTRGFDPNKEHKLIGIRPLMLASNQTIVEVLLDHKADPTHKTDISVFNNTNSYLREACYVDCLGFAVQRPLNPEAIELLLKSLHQQYRQSSSYDMTMRYQISLNTAFLDVCKKKRNIFSNSDDNEREQKQVLKTLKVLIKYGADVNCDYGYERNTALMYAVTHSREMVEFLLLMGADPTLKNKDGKTALMLAEQHNSELVPMLRAAEEAWNRTQSELCYPYNLMLISYASIRAWKMKEGSFEPLSYVDSYSFEEREAVSLSAQSHSVAQEHKEKNKEETADRKKEPLSPKAAVLGILEETLRTNYESLARPNANSWFLAGNTAGVKYKGSGKIIPKGTIVSNGIATILEKLEKNTETQAKFDEILSILVRENQKLFGKKFFEELNDFYEKMVNLFNSVAGPAENEKSFVMR